MPRSSNRVIIVALVVLAATAIVIIGENAATRIGPADLTTTRMFVIHRRILMHAAAHDHPPKTLDEPAILEGYDNEIVDGWKQRIEYQVKDNVVELTSRGQDGAPGGVGEAQDIVRSFELRDHNGHWSNPLSEWLP